MRRCSSVHTFLPESSARMNSSVRVERLNNISISVGKRAKCTGGGRGIFFRRFRRRLRRLAGAESFLRDYKPRARAKMDIGSAFFLREIQISGLSKRNASSKSPHAALNANNAPRETWSE